MTPDIKFRSTKSQSIIKQSCKGDIFFFFGVSLGFFHFYDLENFSH